MTTTPDEAPAPEKEDPTQLIRVGALAKPSPFDEAERDLWPEVQWIEITTVGNVIRNDMSQVKYGSRAAALRYLSDRNLPSFMYQPRSKGYGGVLHSIGWRPGDQPAIVASPPIVFNVTITVVGIDPSGEVDAEGWPTPVRAPDGSVAGPWTDDDAFMDDLDRHGGAAYGPAAPPAGMNPDLWFFRRRKLDTPTP